MRSVHVELLRQGLELHSSISGTDKTPRIRGYQFPALSQSRKKKLLRKRAQRKKKKHTKHKNIQRGLVAKKPLFTTTHICFFAHLRPSHINEPKSYPIDLNPTSASQHFSSGAFQTDAKLTFQDVSPTRLIVLSPGICTKGP